MAKLYDLLDKIRGEIVAKFAALPSKLIIVALIVGVTSAALSLPVLFILGNFQLLRSLAILAFIALLLASFVISLVRFEWGLAMFFLMLPVFSRIEAGLPFELGPVAITPETCFIAVFAFAWLLKSLKRRRMPVVPTKLDWPILLLLLGGVLSLTNAIKPIESSQSLIGGVIQSVALYYIILNNIRYRQQLMTILYAILVGFLIGNAYSVYILWRESYPRLGYIFGNPTREAAFIALSLPLVIALLLIPKARYRRTLNASLMIVGVLMVVSQYLTASRAGMAALLFILIAFLWNRRYRRVAIGVASLGLIAALLFVTFGNIGPAARYGVLVKRLAGDTGFLLGERAYIWKGAIAAIYDQPLFGVGPGNFGEVYPHYMLPEATRVHLSAHDLFLNTWVELGLLSLLALLAILVISFATAITSFRRRREEVSALLSFGLLISLCAGTITSVTGGGLIQTTGLDKLAVPMLFWSLLGFVQVVRNEAFFKPRLVHSQQHSE